jgi:hypothetical protein
VVKQALTTRGHGVKGLLVLPVLANAAQFLRSHVELEVCQSNSSQNQAKIKRFALVFNQTEKKVRGTNEQSRFALGLHRPKSVDLYFFDMSLYGYENSVQYEEGPVSTVRKGKFRLSIFPFVNYQVSDRHTIKGWDRTTRNKHLRRVHGEDASSWWEWIKLASTCTLAVLSILKYLERERNPQGPGLGLGHGSTSVQPSQFSK